MLKILMLNHEFPPVGGGASPVTFQLCKYLVLAGYKVDVVTMHFGDLPRFETVEGFDVYRTPAIRKRPNICHTHEMATYLPGAIKKVLSLVKRNQYDIIHCHFIVPGGPLAWLSAKLTKTPYIITAHGSDIPGYNPDRFTLQHKFTKPLLKGICKNSRKIVCPSIYLKDLIIENIGNYDITHIPNGIDLETFKLDLTKPKNNIILATGRLLKRKGFQTLIKAVHDINMPFEVHIAGDGPYRQFLEQLAENSKTKIVFHGWLEQGSEELLNLYEKALVYVLVSQRENASISLLEGMAAKCVMITTNQTGCPETVGDAGFLIDFEDHEKLKEVLLKLADNHDLVEEYSQKAYERLTEKFLWPQITDRYCEVYSQAALKKVN
ncbi:MAG: glycosyltransferase family 4 protein [Planctomycetota bacterium]|jgi:glycosyltransferase involved in cell wall biosynthesis